MTDHSFGGYLRAVTLALQCTAVTRDGESLPLEAGVLALLEEIKAARARGSTLLWMGNGGSAAIASHEANDFMKNGDCRSMAFHEPSMLTCISNDFGYDRYFEEMVRRFARPGDVAVLISSSGNSENVVRGAQEARRQGCRVVAMTGFRPDNRLRPLGHLSFYVPSMEYGEVELSHQILCHAVLDFLHRDGKVAAGP